MYEFVKKDFSLVTTFDLTCGDYSYIAVIGSTFFIGIMFGGMPRTRSTCFPKGAMIGFWGFPQIADVVGRKKAFYLALTLHQIVATLCPFVHSITAYMILRFVIGVCGSGFGVICFIIVSEELPSKVRATMNFVMNIYFVAGIILISVVSAFCNWRQSLIFVAALGYLFYLFPFLPLLESTKWLHVFQPGFLA